MADNNFRSYRSRDPRARDEFDVSAHETAGDPLAELARLIGQGEPYDAGDAGGGQERRSPMQSGDDMTASGVDWAADAAYADEHDRAEGHAQDRYVPPSADPYPNPTPQDRMQEDEPPPGRYFSGSATKFAGFRADEAGEPRADYAPNPDELPPVAPGRHLPAFASPAYDDRQEGDYREQDGDQYPTDDYEGGAAKPPRRGAVVVVMAVLGLAVLGTAGAFGYHAMFGGSVLPTLPPIIKASNGPNKIMPNYGYAQPSNSGQTSVASAGSNERVAHLAAPAEQPVDVQQSVQTAPRVVSTIPIVASSGPVPAAQMPVGPPAAASAPVVAAPPVPTAADATPPVGVPAAPQMAAPVWPAAPAPAPAASQPKRIHTVTIRADQQESDRAAAAVSSARRRRTSAAAPRRANEPLSIVPGAAADSAAPASEHRRREAAPMEVASAEPITGTAASSGGGYAVQVTSQRSEAEAKAAFRTLRARFPHQLRGRQPIVRRVDLGTRGIYYRALVGPFVSVEGAAEMCSSMKAAGGNCLIQRN